MKLNRKGVTRLVFIFKRFVIKIPNFTYSWGHFLYGLLANIKEGTTWRYNRFYPDKQKLLCPVIWTSWGGWLLIMKRAAEFTIQDFEKSTEKDFKKHKEFFPGDDTISNYGWYNNNLVKIDYGNLDTTIL